MVNWLPLKELFDFEKGALQSSKCTPGKFNFITAAEEWKTHCEYTHENEALIFAMGASGSLGRTHYVNGKFISSDLCFILTPKKNRELDLTFYYRLFNFLRNEVVKKTATGTSKLAINKTNFGNFKIPYFDINHQNQFKGKIESISKITTNINIEQDAQQSLLKQLRQAILQEAVEGKLTAQWRKDNPELISGENHAARLLEKIKSEKERLVKEGRIKKQKPLPPITNEEKPFDLPEGWVWCKLGEICDFITKGTTPATNELKPEGDIPYLKVYNIVNQKIDFLYRPQFISKQVHEKLKRSKVFPGDVLMNIVGPPLGKVALIPTLFQEWNINQALAIFRPIIKELNVFIYLYLLAGFEINKIHTLGVVGQDNISLEQCRNIIFPVIPLHEQKTIVQKLNNFMSKIDLLEQQVTGRKSQAEQLMQSVLREAFAGA